MRLEPGYVVQAECFGGPLDGETRPVGISEMQYWVYYGRYALETVQERDSTGSSALTYRLRYRA